MRITRAEVIWIKVPLVTPFRTSFGTCHDKDTFLLRIETDSGHEGWAECAAEVDPLYSAEWLTGCEHVLEHELLPRIQALGNVLTANRVAPALTRVTGNYMAKHVLETAVLDAELKSVGWSFAHHLGATADRVPAGVSVGIMDSIPEVLDHVDRYLAQGYRRIKLKIEPGWDVAPVAAVRERFGDDIALQVDANAAYTLADAAHLARLDPFGLLLIEQPLPTDDLRGHARLAQLITTPVCLDESIESARDAATAIALQACRVINIKPARVGGYLEARRIHDIAVANGIPVWCGGMLETGIGRGPNLTLAALPGFVLPGDTSASDRYFRQDITTPFVLEDGHVAVPTGPGIGVDVLDDALAEVTVGRRDLPLTSR